MTCEEYRKILKNTFKDVEFFPSDHHYEIKGKKVGISVTRLIDQYANEFDSDKVARIVAKKEGRTVDEVLDEWQYKNEFACNKGTNGHNFAQSLWNDEIYQELPFDGSDTFKMTNKSIYKQAQNFYDDFKDELEHVYDELPVGCEEFDIASCIDHLFYNKKTGGLILVDYKTNAFLKGYNKKIDKKYSKKMKAPLDKIDDDALRHYYIQLSIYKYLIEKYTGLIVEDMFIVYMSENINNYEIIKIPYLKKEVEMILEWRKWE